VVSTKSGKRIIMEGVKTELKYNRTIWVTFRVEGTHCYPAAATDPALKSVDFLQYPHRHLFGFRVSIEVQHNERDIEFIIFKRWLQSLYETNSVLDLNGKSCETIAEELIEKIHAKYPGRAISVSVDEDGENGCLLQSI